MSYRSVNDAIIFFLFFTRTLNYSCLELFKIGQSVSLKYCYQCMHDMSSTSKRGQIISIML